MHQRNNIPTLLGIGIGIVLAATIIAFYFVTATATPRSGSEIQILNWVDQLGDARLTPARHLAQQHLEEAGPAAVDPLITALHSSDPILRRNSAEMLGYIGSPRSLAALVAVMKQDVNVDVRAQSAWAIGNLQDLRTIGPLEQASILDPDPVVRQAALASIDAERIQLARLAGQDETLVSAFAVAPNNFSLIYLAVFNRLWLSHDGGRTWNVAAGILPSRVTSLAIAQDSPGTLYAGTESMGLYKSADAGATWTESNRGLGLDPGVRLEVTALTIDSRKPGRIFAACGVWLGTGHASLVPLGVMQSLDGGATWQSTNLPTGKAAITRLLAIGNTLYGSWQDQVISTEF